MDLTVITEAYNFEEGQGRDALVAAVGAVAGMVAGRVDREAIVVDPTGDPALAAHVGALGPPFRLVAVPGLGYDALKQRAAEAAAGSILVYLDGDCLPESPDWLERLTAPLRDGRAQAATGLTRYVGDDDLAVACTLLDFGFMLDDPGGTLGCYASNNVAFRRDLLLAVPPKVGDAGGASRAAAEARLRCLCYTHAQDLAGIGVPMLSVPEARVRHVLPPLRRERFRRGYDLVSVCWVAPTLPETGLLAGHAGPGAGGLGAGGLGAGGLGAGGLGEGGATSVERRFLEANAALDRERLATYARLFDLPADRAARIRRLMTRLRRLDGFGLRAALREGAATGDTDRALALHRLGTPVASSGAAAADQGPFG